jgi:hypothetical protein
VSYDGDFGEYDEDGAHENCVAMEEAVTYACENHWDEVEEAVNEAHGQDWLSASKPCLELLSAVSQVDQTNAQSSLKKKLQERDGDETVSEQQLFAVATDVSRVVERVAASIPGYLAVRFADDGAERTHEPTLARSLLSAAETCSISDDLTWARDLLLVARAFKDILSAVSDAEFKDPALRVRLREPVAVLNGILHNTPPELLVYWEGKDRLLRFSRCPSPNFPNLSSFAASWVSDYLKNYCLQVRLGVCVECGRFFERERRDRIFCSKTCQNRVAYRRKKILESDALVLASVSPDDACDIAAGLCVHHPRFGIGLIEYVGNESKAMESLLSEMPNTGEMKVRYRSMLSRRIRVKVRFLHGLRVLGYSDLFEGQKREDQLPTFYVVKSEQRLAELL